MEVTEISFDAFCLEWYRMRMRTEFNDKMLRRIACNIFSDGFIA